MAPTPQGASNPISRRVGKLPDDLCLPFAATCTTRPARATCRSSKGTAALVDPPIPRGMTKGDGCRHAGHTADDDLGGSVAWFPGDPGQDRRRRPGPVCARSSTSCTTDWASDPASTGQFSSTPASGAALGNTFLSKSALFAASRFPDSRTASRFRSGQWYIPTRIS